MASCSRYSDIAYYFQCSDEYNFDMNRDIDFINASTGYDFSFRIDVQSVSKRHLQMVLDKILSKSQSPVFPKDIAKNSVVKIVPRRTNKAIQHHIFGEFDGCIYDIVFDPQDCISITTGLSSVGSAPYYLKKILEIDLSFNKLKLDVVMRALQQNSMLRSLRLDGNIFCESAASLFSSWQNSSVCRLTTLSLRRCSVAVGRSLSPIEIIARSLGSSTSMIERLDLSENNIGAVLDSALSLGLLRGQHLVSVKFDGNDLSAKSLFLLGLEVGWSSWELLSFSECSIGGHSTNSVLVVQY